MNIPQNIFSELMSVIEDRKKTMPEGSYTTALLTKGIDKISAKIIEETNELIEAGHGDDKQHITREAADLVYHMFVLLGYCEIPLSDVENELAKRFGISGLEEKASRKK
jgi:phosphoribosyl-ATP pyrophosphohydrolase